MLVSRIVLVLLPLAAFESQVDARLRRGTADDCEMLCRDFATSFQESVCEPYRHKVPRPALYSRCVESYADAVSDGCAYCSASQNKLDHITDKVFHYCDKWGRGYERSYERACQDGYLSATRNVKKFIQDYNGDESPRMEAAIDPPHGKNDVESAESIVQRHLNEARREAISEYENRDRY